MGDKSLQVPLKRQILNSLSKELGDLCGKDTPSILRRTEVNHLHNLTLSAIQMELKERAPFFYDIMVAMCVSKDTKYNHMQLGTDIAMGKVVAPAAIILKSRCKDMKAWALKNSLALQYGGCSNMVCVLCSLCCTFFQVLA